MRKPTPASPPGHYDERYRAFLKVIADERPRLHRYCSRMVGSVFDGEDVAQETLIQAYRRLDQYDESRPMAPWLLGIAHHRCLDFLRRRKVRGRAEESSTPVASPAIDPDAAVQVPGALETLVLCLAPKERACFLLKDVLDYPLEDIATVVDSSVGGVKAALRRARTKLAAAAATPKPARSVSPRDSLVLRLYVERFNRHDWDGVLELTRADARLEVLDTYRGPLVGSPYFSRYEAARAPWRFAVGVLDGEAVALRLNPIDGRWTPTSAVRLELSGDRIEEIRDYVLCPWLLSNALTLASAEP
jgi:RNA polymerase sigma-70 factor (ECF subfamily)